MTRFRSVLTYANVMASIAVFIALGGTGYAAMKLPKNSVGAKQIKKNGVGSQEIKKNAVTSAKVKDRSLRPTDFAAGALPAGPVGPRGPEGARGPDGQDGRSALQVLRSGETVRGGWAVAGAYPDNGAQLTTGVSLPVPAPTAIDSDHLKVDGQSGETVCEGTTADPTAPPGYACVYPRPSQGVFSYSVSPFLNEPSRFGFAISVQGNGVYKSAGGYGTWAYTAP